MRPVAPIALAAFCLAASAGAQSPTDFFETRVRPVLADNCYACHARLQSGGLRVDSREALLEGRRLGPRHSARRPRRQPARPRRAPRDRGRRDAPLRRPPGGAGRRGARRVDPDGRALAAGGAGDGFGRPRTPGDAAARGHRGRACLLVVPAPRGAGRAGAVPDRLGAQRHRPVRPRQAGGEGARPPGPRRPASARPPGDLRPDGAAADPGRDRRLPGRRIARRVREGRRPAARLAPLRRALGPPLARRRPLRRGRHPRAGRGRVGARALPVGLGPARLGGRRLQPRHALGPLREGAARGRPARRAGAHAGARRGWASSAAARGTTTSPTPRWRAPTSGTTAST